MRPSPLSLRLAAAFVAIAAGLPAPAARAQQEEPRAIPLVEVPGRAEETRAELDAFRPGKDSREALERIDSELDRSLPEIEAGLAETRDALAAQPGVRTLRGLRDAVGRLQARLLPWDEELESHLVPLRDALRELDAISAVWDATAELAQQEGAAGATVARIAGVRREIDQARAAVVERREQILAVRDRLVDPRGALSASLEEIRSATEAQLLGIFQVDRPPLWSSRVRESLREEWSRMPELAGERLREGGEDAREEVRMLGLQLALFVVLLLGLRALRDRARVRAGDDYDLRSAEEAFELPGAMALLLAVTFTEVQPLAPRGADLVAGLLIALAVLRIGRRFLVAALTPLVWGLVALYAVDRVRDLLEALPTLERIVFLLETAGALGFLVWLQRPSRLAALPPELRRAPFLRPLGIAMRAAAVLLALAIVADLAGWGNLASLLGNAAVRSGYLGLFTFVLFRVLQSLLAYALVLWPLRLVRAIARHRLTVRRQLERVLRLVAVVAWAGGVLAQLGLLGSARDAVAAALRAGLTVGALSVSLGDVLAFGVAVWLSFQLARVVDFLLEEDVFTRVRAARGVPYAIAGVVRYTLIFFGFLVGLAAAGIELTKLTVIAGGLGVGIGFGLQNVVNNFVSGLVLLFERPIQVGDRVQLPDVWGEVKSIGIRASVIRSFDGAEVIVPNGMLISERVTNWTFSDRKRRVEVAVGVEYGTPARRVIDLLVGVARGNPQVLSDPEPTALFLNFGDSALEFTLRAWIGEFDDGYAVRSDLAVAVQEALRESGIGVPFPQRDLHLVSVRPGAASSLGIPPQGGSTP